MPRGLSAAPQEVRTSRRSSWLPETGSRRGPSWSKLSPASAGFFRAPGRNENRRRVALQPGWVS